MKENAHILVVDDNESMSKSMSMILAYKGYAVTTAGDGFEAIEKVKENAFDAIFMDIKMPGINGVGAYREIRRIRPRAVVVMMSGYADKHLVEEALQEGAYGALDKPFDVDNILTMIDEIIKGKQRARSR